MLQPPFSHPALRRPIARSLAVAIVLAATGSLAATAQTDTTLTVWECIRYAVAHSHTLRQRELQLDNARATRLQAIGAFLPSVGASVSAQVNFGRAIDPETNTYTHVSTFGNGYGVSTSLPVFDGFYRLHALRAARADELMQKNALAAERDQVALQTYQAYADAVYAHESLALARNKRRDSEQLLRMAQVMADEGLKSPADVARMQAQVAADVLAETKQENLVQTTMLKLEELMGMDDFRPLRLSAGSLALERHAPPGHTSGAAPALMQQSYHAMQSARHNLRMARAAFFPTLSLAAGINTSFHRSLSSPEASSFGRQLKNNLGQYVSASVSIPLFGRLGTAMGLRRARNNLRIAQEQYAARAAELNAMRCQASMDVEACVRESEQGAAKVCADSLAYELVRRQFAEGLASPPDVQSAATALLQSRAELLQSRIMVGIKAMQLRYYEGEPLQER